ncbi:hypothetical protein RR48_09536 [Papilio machaon]|uniref:Aldehyde dehydrogenase family 16 member A1 n=1 Tax=Papilio machaon TaxID=76193 RepID=A0A194QY57_PAPMA|nr:hypothetical protein RR48_09536 [Papilio machaon]
MVDTQKAKEYMKTNEVFHSLGYSDMDEYAIDACGNKIMYSDYQRNIDLFTSSVWEEESSVLTLSNNLKALAKLIEGNELLFAQIEYMARKKPTNESVNIDLKLIVQNILYVSSAMTKKRYTSNVVAMQGGSPLCMLGFVAQLVCSAQRVVVEAVPHTAVLCHLFVTLCRKAGLNVSLAFVKEPFSADIDCEQIKEMQRGCICVVTERSDVESAVHTFIASATQDPWRIRRVLVQESIVERLKHILEWKSKRNSSYDGSMALECSSAYHIKEKLFLFEYSGLEHSDGHVVIEAYRTVKELLSLFNIYKPFAVSLWCSDISQANEIAYGIDSTVIWINDYGSFEGPLKSSQAFYSIIDISYAKERIRHSFDVKNLTNRALNWSKLDVSERYKLLNVGIGKAEKAGLSKSLSIPAIDSNIEDGNFVKVTNVGICVGIEMRDIPFVLFREIEIKSILTCLLQGFAVVLPSVTESLGVVLKLLEEEGAPVVYKGVSGSEECLVTSQFSQYKVKVVRTNFGTIFAN